jgi:hypothetical protein
MQQSEQSATQLEINSRISRTLLGRREALSNAPLTIRDAPRLAFLIRQFHRGLQQQRRRDAETLAGLVRALSNPRNRVDADRFFAIVKEELDSKGN